MWWWWCVRMCVRLFAPVLPHWRAAWQNHYGLCKHILTSPLKSPLPHTNMHKITQVSHAQTHTHTLTNIHHYCICEHTFYPCPPKMFISKSCRCSLIATVADTHVLNILIAYFLMFVYRIATCRSEITHIYSLTLHLV